MGVCTKVARARTSKFEDEWASPVQLNAFEFRNYRTALEEPQQQVLERIVNQWCAMLVKGKSMVVEGLQKTVHLDKDLLSLIYDGEFYQLKAISKLELFKDGENLIDGGSSPYGLDVTFEGEGGNVCRRFSFEQEAHRLNFALTLRILRTRDPELDPSSSVAVEAREDSDEEEDHQTFAKIVNAQHYLVDAGIPIVFSVSDLKIYEKLQSSSRHTYLEFFVRYPRQDRFLYAKSPTTHIPPQVLQTEDASLRRKKDKKVEDEDEEERKKEETKRAVLGDEIPIRAMRFELKNVKLKVPKIPHQIFGRLMAKDEYFPTAIGTFDFNVTKGHLQNRMKDPDERKKGNKKEKELPETMRIPMYSSWKARTKDSKEETYIKIGTLTIRLMGYVTESTKAERQGQKAHNRPTSPGDEISDEEEEDENEDEEEEDGSGSSSGSGSESGSGSGSGSGSSSGSGSGEQGKSSSGGS